MASNSHFQQLAHLITVTDICTPFWATLESRSLVKDVWEEWSLDLWIERGLDPMEQMALVTDDNKIIGWIGFDMLDNEKSIHDCMELITPASILSSDTSLLDSIASFETISGPFFLILQGNQFIGWLSYKDLHKQPLRLCLFSMLINLERMLLEVALKNPKGSFQNLKENRIKKAQELYKFKNFNFTQSGDYYISKLMECTNMIDKFTIAQHTQNVVEMVPALKNQHLCRKAEMLRNEIAHASIEEHSSKLLNRDSLWPFIQWAESLEEQLQNYLESTRGY